MFAPCTEKSRTDSAAWRRDQEARRLRQQGSFSVSLWHTAAGLGDEQACGSVVRPTRAGFLGKFVILDEITFYVWCSRHTNAHLRTMSNRTKVIDIWEFILGTPRRRTVTLGRGPRPAPLRRHISCVLAHPAAGRSSGAGEEEAQDEEHTRCLYCVGGSSV
jgi:hypothetical protein